ncbi:hypothetical protein [Natrarchaeobius oligotrophus]|uniref:Uncharacterized protein n=1 Tax=Natrarchaeobius chitinivorans TaxID=1679083 RepID=A0A3N6MDT4_NATCH|nr:hypothetical protein [Natrarchaeobius chitinivorans]RQG93731.1 hypothetical protein EA472_22620 [Natrarchaeobius chitinivorans]
MTELTISATLTLEDIDLEYGEAVCRVDVPGSSPSTVRSPIEDLLGWTARREERRLEEYYNDNS